MGSFGLFSRDRRGRLCVASGVVVAGGRSGVYLFRGIFCASPFHFAWSLALSAFLLAGALHIQVRNSLGRLDTGIQPYANHQELEIVAHVIRDGRIQQAGMGESRQTLDVETEQLRTADGEIVPVHSGIRLNIYSPRSKDAAAEDEPGASVYSGPALHYGDRIRLTTKLKLPRNFRNPGAFDYEGYLADHGIAALGSAKVGEVVLLPGFTGNRILSWRSRMHASIVTKVHELWPPATPR